MFTSFFIPSLSIGSRICDTEDYWLLDFIVAGSQINEWACSHYIASLFVVWLFNFFHDATVYGEKLENQEN